VAHDPAALPPELTAFLTERHLGTLTLVAPDGVPHVTPVGFTWDPAAGLVRVITWNGSRKARLLERHGPLQAAVGSVDGGRWCTLGGIAEVTADPDRCADAVRRYAERYRPPKDRGPDRRAIELRVIRVLGRG
jgi:PPOX class probable F420-dependent enzyme